ncbi:MAG: N-acetylneuraminate anomerase [Vibrio hibernica]
MFLGDLNQPASYALLPQAFQVAIDYLQKTDLVNLSNGRHEIDGDKMFANVMSFETGDANKKRAEVHLDYIDMQVLISGEERIEFALDGKHTHATEYDKEGDYYLVENLLNRCEVTLSPAQFAIFFPSEPHKPGCIVTQSSLLKKVVVKIHRDCLA